MPRLPGPWLPHGMHLSFAPQMILAHRSRNLIALKKNGGLTLFFNIRTMIVLAAKKCSHTTSDIRFTGVTSLTNWVAAWADSDNAVSLIWYKDWHFFISYNYIITKSLNTQFSCISIYFQRAFFCARTFIHDRQYMFTAEILARNFLDLSGPWKSIASSKRESHYVHWRLVGVRKGIGISSYLIIVKVPLSPLLMVRCGSARIIVICIFI